jgi:tRNA A37 threonylcarbamoyladenosine synthetase subunit TsaC/SUA5/YrdC
LIKTSGLPIAAPSANKFGHVSPTKAEHVYNDFHLDSEVYIVDGGQCSFGIESTVLKISYD